MTIVTICYSMKTTSLEQNNCWWSIYNSKQEVKQNKFGDKLIETRWLFHRQLCL